MEDWGDHTVLSRRYVRAARAEHVCAWCGVVIRAGQSYMREVGLVDGAFVEQKRHDYYCD